MTWPGRSGAGRISAFTTLTRTVLVTDEVPAGMTTVIGRSARTTESITGKTGVGVAVAVVVGTALFVGVPVGVFVGDKLGVPDAVTVGVCDGV